MMRFNPFRPYVNVLNYRIERLILACLYLLSVSLLLSLSTVLYSASAQTSPTSSLTLEQKAELEALFKEANAAYEIQDFQTALSLFQKGLKRAEAVKAPLYSDKFLYGLGNVYYSLGQNDKALDFYNQALELERKNHASPVSIADTLNNLGVIYHILGQNDKALDFYNQALELYRNNHAPPLYIAGTLTNLGNVYKAFGQNDKALDLFTQALELYRKNNAHPLYIADTLNNLGMIYNDLGQNDKALDFYSQALELKRKNHASPISIAGALNNLGLVYLALGQNDRALALLIQALDLKRNNQASPISIADTLNNLGVVYRAMGQSEKARDFFLGALFARYPQLRDIAENRPAKYTRLERMAQDNPDTLYLEYGFADRQTALLFALGSRDGLKSLTLPLDYWELQKAVQTWRAALEVSGGRGVKSDNPGERSKVAGEEKALAQQVYAFLLDEAEKAGLLADGRYKRLVIVGSGPLLDIPLAALCDGQGRRLVERYALSRALSLSVSFWRSNPMRSKASLLCIADPTGTEDQQAKQCEPDKSGKKLATNPPSSAPSTFRTGFVPLPEARSEGHAVAALYPDSKLLVGPDAKEASVLKLLPDFDILHFATHGFLVPNDVKSSGLVLAEEPSNSPNDGMLSARKILGLPLSARLAVLSACETGRGLSKGGEGLMGLAWAFRAAGVPAVVASQWQVDDAATKQLMVAFYTGIKAGKPKDEALRDAMLAVQKEHPSPFYWAAFELIGDANPLK